MNTFTSPKIDHLNSSIEGFAEVLKHAGRGITVERTSGAFDLWASNKDSLTLVKVLNINPDEENDIQKKRDQAAKNIQKVRVPPDVDRWLVLRVEDNENNHSWLIYLITDSSVLPGPSLGNYHHPDQQINLLPEEKV